MSGRQRGYRLVRLAEVESICGQLEGEHPPGWELLVDELHAAMEKAERKRLPPTAFKFWPVLGSALDAVRKPSPHRGVNRAKVPLG